MEILQLSKAIAWSKLHKIDVDEAGKVCAANTALHKRRFQIPKDASKHLSFCRFVEFSLRPWTRCLFWVTAWGIWESSENWHLYYRLRESYGDRRLLDEAPAHLFLDYENHDLTSFLQIALSAGWDCLLLTSTGYCHAAISHDEWIEFFMRDKVELEKLSTNLAQYGVKQLPTR